MPAKKAPKMTRGERAAMDDLDVSIARRVARNKDYLALLADAQARTQVFNAEQRVAELEDLLAKERLGSAVERKAISELSAEVTRLRRALKQQKPADDDVHALVRGLKALTTGRITVTKLPKKKAPKKWVSPLGQSVREAIAKRMRNPKYRAAAEAAAKKKKAPKKKTTPRAERREIIRKAGAKDRAVLNRLRDYDKNP